MGVPVDVEVGVKVVVAVGVMVAKSLETVGMLLRPNDKTTPMTPKINIPTRRPKDRRFLLVFVISF